MGKKVTDSKLLEAMLVHGGASGAAGALGISRNAIYKRLQDEDFRMEYDRLQGIMLSTAAAGMSAALDDAIGYVRDVIRNDAVNKNTRVNAADSLLRHCVRYVEMSAIVRRMDALEQTLKELEK